MISESLPYLQWVPRVWKGGSQKTSCLILKLFYLEFSKILQVEKNSHEITICLFEKFTPYVSSTCKSAMTKDAIQGVWGEGNKRRGQ